jgi:hypothetical protein
MHLNSPDSDQRHSTYAIADRFRVRSRLAVRRYGGFATRLAWHSARHIGLRESDATRMGAILPRGNAPPRSEGRVGSPARRVEYPP